MSTARAPSPATPVSIPVHDGRRWRGRRERRARPHADGVPGDPGADGGPLGRPDTARVVSRREVALARARSAAALVQRAAFWVAVTLPVLYVPFALSPAALTWSPPGVGAGAPAGSLVVALVALHLLAVVVGHGHARRES